ncbi:MAG: hypothetical protein PHP30_03315 [Bacteroidales bacterium]|nr:hypothetical protein [Bacteroidales bacterium]MDD2424956.1 hypothetical protein [Bacteroidales bacterium]MDD3989108.1 hypothetical protein [Bacteroidales bacterium]
MKNYGKFWILIAAITLLSGSLSLKAQPSLFPFLKDGVSTLMEFGTGGKARLVVLQEKDKNIFRVNMILAPGSESELKIPDWGMFYVKGRELYFGQSVIFGKLDDMLLYSLDSNEGSSTYYLLEYPDPEESCPEDWGLYERIIVSMNETVVTKGGVFENCVHVKQVSNNEPRVTAEFFIDRNMGFVKIITTVVEGDYHSGDERKFSPLVFELAGRG